MRRAWREDFFCRRCIQEGQSFVSLPSPIPSMCGKITYIYHKNQPNLGKCTIHGWYGSGKSHQGPKKDTTISNSHNQRIYLLPFWLFKATVSPPFCLFRRHSWSQKGTTKSLRYQKICISLLWLLLNVDPRRGTFSETYSFNLKPFQDQIPIICLTFIV